METKDSKIEIESVRFQILMATLIVLVGISIYLIRSQDADNFSWRAKQQVLDSMNVADAKSKQNQIITSVQSSEKKIDNLTSDVKVYRSEVVKNTNAHKESLENFNNLKNQNEKDYIPSATTEQQLDFISKYKFEPIETK
ncbi:hypothetical protein [Epilithonimonas sp.]|uniref:hypothetical protein n=1 Tax=Epilithonimonas sp. TaxID=2894511 RepID=UPI0035AE1079